MHIVKKGNYISYCYEEELHYVLQIRGITLHIVMKRNYITYYKQVELHSIF
jgi:hypothetical protein